MSELKRNWTGSFDSIEDAIIAIRNIRTTEGKLVSFEAQWHAVVEAVNEIHKHTNESK